ncbi:DUF1780 family protein [Rhizobium laguerreae]|uniref:DUF1780 domain-containing protein n=1 Tax=Rhizobium laguerreae TaxID=1076926 RepID=UPI001C913B34|nr:DUF1780 domain-containing protein [Rhizobium laguerreae]MBY3155435.1 DUF1780 family protein [Rhizobium laguerreae]
MAHAHYIKRLIKKRTWPFCRPLYLEWDGLVSTEQEYLKAFRDEAAEAKALFSNAGQQLQERTAVAGFLRVLGIEFLENEIIKRGPEPIDIWFRDARFQVTEILDESRQRNREISERAERSKKAKSLDDLLEPWSISSEPMAPRELVDLASARSNSKADHYGQSCNGVDLLIYLNLKRRHVYPPEPFPPFPESARLCWRSVSVVMEHFAIVLWTAADAPSFLVQRMGKGMIWSKGPESVFPKLKPSQER